MKEKLRLLSDNKSFYPDREEEEIEFAKIDSSSRANEIIETLNAFSTFAEENELRV